MPSNETYKDVIVSMFQMKFEYMLSGYLSQAMLPTGLGMWHVCLQGQLCCTAVDVCNIPGGSYIEKKTFLASLSGPEHFALVEKNGGMAINMVPGRAVWVPPGFMLSQHAKADTCILTWPAIPVCPEDSRRKMFRKILASNTCLLASYPSLLDTLKLWISFVEIEAK